MSGPVVVDLGALRPILAVAGTALLAIGSGVATTATLAQPMGRLR
jgi:hypothetical protein